jgi:serine/threonine-protein kinase RsbW
MAELHNFPPPPCALRRAPFIELQQHLPSQIAAIPPFVDRLTQFLKTSIEKLSDADGDEIDIRIALGEALANAVIHGNRENTHKCVYVTCRLNMDGEVLLTVRDEGEGFDCYAIPDPTDRHNCLLPNGRGIYFMRAFMDEVYFEENGKVVHLRKRLRRQEPGSNG